MRRLLPIFACLVGACDEAEPIDDRREARALLAEVRDAGYEMWLSDAIEGDAPHGAWSIIFLDPTMAAALAGPSRDAWPDGATIVCEGRETADGDAELVMIMRKQRGAWRWAQYDADDEPQVWGAATGCVHCHAAGQDFTRVVELP
ncbi:MAG TPA: cytochrome P460 family protein [Nannocystaceae bacterium]|nr:cytochrome P460 family protein [Nannocystaceae bacterium]